MTLSSTIGNMPLLHYTLFSVAALGLTGFGFHTGFRGLKRARLIADVPTSRIRSAPQGQVELNGQAKAMDGAAIIAPLSSVPCCWYRYQIEERDDNRWDTVERGVSDGLFLLQDDTGSCIVDPEGADVTPGHREVWHGDGSRRRGVAGGMGPGGTGIGDWFAARGIRITTTGFGDDYRYTEELILPGDPLYAMGWFKSLDDLDHARSRGEITRELLAQWKRDEATLQARFDRNRDGRIDPDEWEHAREVASRQAADDYAEQLEHLHTLARPAVKGYPFILSNLPQDRLVSRYRWRSIGGFVLFLVAGSGATLLLTARLPHLLP